MEMPKPQEQHRRLSELAGTWTGDETMYPSPWDPKGGKASGRVVSKIEMDGFFLLYDYVQERGSQPSYRGHGVFGWDGSQKCYTMHWFDSMGSPSGEPMKGTWEEKSLVFQAKGPMGHSRITYNFEGKDRFQFLMEGSQDGKQWAKMMEGTYTKK
jgi:uncharacterized protein DUF1579